MQHGDVESNILDLLAVMAALTSPYYLSKHFCPLFPRLYFYAVSL